MSNSVQLDLYVEADVLTAGCCREIVNSIFESLLYQRNQIPFVYKTYRYYVSKWLEDDEKSDLGTMSVGVNFHLQRQRDRAKLTQKTISSMKEVGSLRYN